MKSQVLFAVAAGAVILAACGDEKSTTVNETSSLEILAKGDTLPECNESIEGKMIHVSDSSQVYYCSDSSWVTLDGEDGEDGNSGKDGKDGEDGNSGKDGKNGVDGSNGNSCTAKSIDEGIEVSCDGVVIDTVLNVKNGADGKGCTAESIDEGIVVSCAGVVADTVLNGTNGSDGKSCTAKSIAEGVEVSCAGVVIDTVLNGENGADGKSCTAKSIEEGTQVSCDGVVIDTITNGQDGADGESCTVGAISEGFEISCGGVVIDTIANGKDGSNGSSCSIRDTSDDYRTGYKVICDDENKGVLWNGANGSVGKGCILTDNGDGLVKISCETDTTTLYKAMCVMKPYDPAVSFCLNGVVYDLCNGATYDPVKILCWEGKPYSCDNKAYNPTTHFCYNDSIYDFCGGESYSPASQYCLTLKDSEGIETSKVEALLTDSRDNQVYKTVTIGSQVWMAQNLNFTPDTTDAKYEGYMGRTWCYYNKVDSCAKYGRLYTWAAAIDSAGAFSSNAQGCGYKNISACTMTKPVQGICPEGWHIPDTTEFAALYNEVGGKESAGAVLKTTSGWKMYDGEDANGSDSYGFSVMPAGYVYYDDHNFISVGSETHFWSITKLGDNDAKVYNVVFKNQKTSMVITTYFMGSGYSIRCVKDDE